MPVTAELGTRVAGNHRRRALHAGHAAEGRQAIEHLDAGHGRNLAVLLDEQEHHAFAERTSEMSLGFASEMGELRLAGVHPPVLERLGDAQVADGGNVLFGGEANRCSLTRERREIKCSHES